MTWLEKAIEIALSAHRGQKDKAGAPYILHPLRLMQQMRDENEQIVAVLHDVTEDSRYTIESLRKEGFSKEIIAALECLSRSEGEPYENYIDRLRFNPLAKKVKLADLKDNMNITRLSNLNEKDIERLKKYHLAWMKLIK
jgi:(p)ppGpp synthase/HD superfamily hydrolase